MADFFQIVTSSPKRGVFEIKPKFLGYGSTDLMIRGGDFYAVWLEDRGLWSTKEEDAIRLIDAELTKYYQENADSFETPPRVLYLWDVDNGMIDKWRRFVSKQLRESYHPLDENLTFLDDKTTKTDYASKRLPYPLKKGPYPAFERLMSTLYSPKERHKIEWAIGAIVSGDSKTIQKFVVLYGSAGTGKSTVLNIIQMLFKGYYSSFNAKTLGSSNSEFAMEQFSSNPLVAIQHDGDLSRIEDNTRLNSLVSHEMMTVNEKYRSAYQNKFNTFLFMGTNKPVRITDAKSGLIRRLIDVSPTGNRLPVKEYQKAMKLVEFELGAIAWHCREVYMSNPQAYDNYIPTAMLGASNNFYNFMLDSYFIFKKDNRVTAKVAYEMYKTYCKDANVAYVMPRMAFKEELKNYFDEYSERQKIEDGSRLRNVYTGFKANKFDVEAEPEPEPTGTSTSINFINANSIFDEMCKDYPAQYAKEDGTPQHRWTNVTTKLSDLDTTQLHYVRVPENHIVIDFDIPDEEGNKSFEKNLAEASKWPPTYAELSKSGAGIHLHYLYSGDPKKLSRIYKDHVEIKVFTGNSSLRRKLSLCNDLPIATLDSGLPLKGEKMVNKGTLKSESSLRTLIRRNLAKEIHSSTSQSINFIYSILEEAYASGMKYDVTDMRKSVLTFAANSSNQKDRCLKLVNEMKFKSAEETWEQTADFPADGEIVFYDVEVFPNLFLVNWKVIGEGKKIVRMINPTPEDIAKLVEFKLVGFNCRRYDNHILYARMIGYDNQQLYRLSQRIVNSSKGGDKFFGEAYNLSYTDIYDLSSKKQSLKKWEIELGIHHQELGLPWDEPVPEEMWSKVAEYCDNDVIATEAVWNAKSIQADWMARQILADIAGMSVNDTTNALTTRIIFGTNRKPQDAFHYRNLAEPVHDLDPATMEFLKEAFPEMMAKPHGDARSLLPYFPGYVYDCGKSIYRGEITGEGGRAKGLPGIYYNAALLDITSMHPHSVEAECLFGVEYTKRFREIVNGRVDIKHKDWDAVNNILDGKLAPYIKKVKNGELSNKQLANALKIAINSVYGLTAANFDNAFRDIRNKDNIVAKRGALFMLDLEAAVREQGFQIVHTKTDSVKIPNATPQIIDFVMKFGKRYGYSFEHEATYERICLVNDAVYIAKYADKDWCLHEYGYIPGDNEDHSGEWTATGKQFQIPYVFKTLFSKEPIKFEDLCETKSVKTALYLDMNEGMAEAEAKAEAAAKELAKYRQKYKKGEINDTTFGKEYERLQPEIDKGHDYHFVGKVGLFCPIKPGCGGGKLVRAENDKYDSVTGAKGWRWLEAEMVRTLNKEDDIDIRYYQKLASEAIETIEKYGNFDAFTKE